MNKNAEIHPLISQKIHHLRIKNGWTMEEFGEKLNTSKGTVNNWEKGRNLPSKKMLKKIADIANINVSELLYHNPLEQYSTKELLKELHRRMMYV